MSLVVVLIGRRSRDVIGRLSVSRDVFSCEDCQNVGLKKFYRNPIVWLDAIPGLANPRFEQSAPDGLFLVLGAPQGIAGSLVRVPFKPEFLFLSCLG